MNRATSPVDDAPGLATGGSEVTPGGGGRVECAESASVHVSGGSPAHAVRRTPLRWVPVLLWLLASAITLPLFRNYGLAWDEHYQYHDNGRVNLDYVRTGRPERLLRGNEKYHGPAYEILLVSLNELFHVRNMRSVYLTRHGVNHVLFLWGVAVLYLLARRLYGDRRVALLAAAMLLLHPRMFGHSYFNTKDIPFLALYAACVYTLLTLLRRPGWGALLVHAGASGFLIAIRIPGLAIAAATVLCLLVAAIRVPGRGSPVTAGLWGSIPIYLAVASAVVYLGWPVLWEGPLTHFAAAFREMRKFTNVREALYLGRYYPVDQLPWHYVPVWIAISTPMGYLAAAAMGLVSVVADMTRDLRNFVTTRWQELVVGLCYAIPIGAVVVFQSTVYDDWRHLYFLYPFLVLLAARGVWAVIRAADRVRARTGRIAIRAMAWAVPLLGAVSAVAHIVRTHPYEYVYFNGLAGRDMVRIKRNFELDYWGLTFRRGLEAVLERDPEEVVPVCVSNNAGFFASEILPPEQRRRLHYVRRPEQARYFLTNYRWHPHDYPYSRRVFAVRRDGVDLLTVFDLRAEDPLSREPTP